MLTGLNEPARAKARVREKEREKEKEKGREREERMRAPPVPTPTAAKVRANLHIKESSAPRSVLGATTVVQPDLNRAASHRAQVFHPNDPYVPPRLTAHERLKEAVAREREKAERQRERMKTPPGSPMRDERYYGVANTFAHQIALALNEPEGAAPISVDWDRYLVGRKDYGTMPPTVARKTSRRV